jgi:hypothetical protein
MRAMFAAVIFSGLSLFTAAPAFSDDICEAVALRPVPAVDNPDAVLKPGQIVRAVSQYRVSKKDKLVTLCSHGGNCYPIKIMENGALVEALRLTNCRVGKRLTDDDPDDYYYDLVVIRSKVSPVALKVDDLDNKLLDLGLCTACAHNAAYLAVHQPRSRCAALVKRALGGDQIAVKALTVDYASSACSVR